MGMHRLGKLQKAHLMALVSVVLGALIGFTIMWGCAGGIGLNESSKEGFLLTAFFLNERLVISISSMSNSEVAVEIIFLEGMNYVDFEMPTNVLIKPGEKIELQTNIMQPTEKGIYVVKVKLSNGRILSCRVAVG